MLEALSSKCHLLDPDKRKIAAKEISKIVCRYGGPLTPERQSKLEKEGTNCNHFDCLQDVHLEKKVLQWNQHFDDKTEPSSFTHGGSLQETFLNFYDKTL